MKGDCIMTVQQAIDQARHDLKGVEYLAAAKYYETDEGVLSVFHRKDESGSCLLGLFEGTFITGNRSDVIEV
jgi:hypothetical protein